MAEFAYTGRQVPFAHVLLNGGLNSQAGALGLQDNEASDLKNITFETFGSIRKRNGYNTLTNLAKLTDQAYGLHWFEYNANGTTTQHAIKVAASQTNLCRIMKMDNLDGTWDDVTGNTSFKNQYVDFTNFLNEVYMTSEGSPPSKWTGGGNCALIATPANLQWAKYNEEYNNYLFLGSCKVENTHHNSRIYWSTIQNTNSWTATNYIDISKNDGQEITRIKKLADRLVIYKTRSIYNLFFTGDATIPFTLPGGGKAASEVGCIAPFSIQEVNNGHVFLSQDGFYYYDGINSYKISDRITKTLGDYNSDRFKYAQSTVQRERNRYLCTFAYSSSTNNSDLVIWNYLHNAWTIHRGLDPSALATFYVNGSDERVYFEDYNGYSYRYDVAGLESDYPTNTETAIDAYYYTNWKSFSDIVSQKGVPEAVIYYEVDPTDLTLAYSYDLETADQYTQTFNLNPGLAEYGSAHYGVDRYARRGGYLMRRDLTGRGRVVRFGFKNAIKGETFQIDGFGTFPYLETEA